MNFKEKNLEETEKKSSNRITFKKLKKQVKGITLIALVVTIALNCCRSGRKLEYIA